MCNKTRRIRVSRVNIHIEDSVVHPISAYFDLRSREHIPTSSCMVPDLRPDPKSPPSTSNPTSLPYNITNHCFRAFCQIRHHSKYPQHLDLNNHGSRDRAHPYECFRETYMTIAVTALEDTRKARRCHGRPTFLYDPNPPALSAFSFFILQQRAI